MAVIPITLPGYYDIVWHMSNTANPNDQWRNTFTFKYPSVPPVGADLLAALGGLVQACTREDSQIDGYDVYNWSRGRQPYPAGLPVTSFRGVAAGTAHANWPHLNTAYVAAGGEIALRMDHDTMTPSKPGRTFFRGLLGAADIHAVTGGKWTLVPTVADLQADLNAIMTATGLGAFIDNITPAKQLVVVRWSKVHAPLVASAAEINSLNIIGVTTNRQTRKNPR